LRVNGTEVSAADPGRRLLDFLRGDLGLTGAKEGCGMGECGACTVLLDGDPACSCLVLVGQIADREVITVEGLGERGHSAVQRAFVQNHASQCGFCTPGMILSLTALFTSEPHPSSEQLRTSLVGNLCRCTGFGRIFQAAREVGAR
jgi:carbon-monoxide dehydrogenase small subunit